MWSRRDFVAGAGGTIVAGVLAHGRPALAAPPTALARALARIERESGGRLGVAILDTATGARWGHRAGERFPMCSTFKFLLVAAILSRVDQGRERIDRRTRYARDALVPHSPVTARHVGTGMTIAGLCAATMTQSDNAAANLLLATMGGPAALTAYARSIGDAATRLDRIEPALNEARPGDPRDTTTPDAMAANLRSVVLGRRLSRRTNALMQLWLVGNQTGDAKLRAGLPPGWRVGDKTGGGERGTTNDIAVIWPTGRAPVILCAYLTGTQAPIDARNAALAEVARATVRALGAA